MEKKKRLHFPDEFKRQALERVETSGLPFFEVAAELGVHESQLRRWARVWPGRRVDDASPTLP